MKPKDLLPISALLIATSFPQDVNTANYKSPVVSNVLETEKAIEQDHIKVYIEESISEEDKLLYESAASVFNRAITNLPEYLRAQVTESDLRLVVFESQEFLNIHTENSPLAKTLFEHSPMLPNSGVDDATWINNSSPRWNDYSDATKVLYIGGEIFRNLQARLGVDINSLETDNYALEIPDWFFYGSPLAWSAAQLGDEQYKEIVSESQEAYLSSGASLQDMSTPGSLISLGMEAYYGTTYLVDTLVNEFGDSDESKLLWYYYLLGSGLTHDESLGMLFEINEEEYASHLSSN